MVLLVEHLDESPITSKDIASWTSKDATLSQIRQFIQQGFPDSSPEPGMEPFVRRQTELSVLNGCILWGSRVFVPEPGRQPVLDELHEGHPGIREREWRGSKKSK